MLPIEQACLFFFSGRAHVLNSVILFLASFFPSLSSVFISRRLDRLDSLAALAYLHSFLYTMTESILVASLDWSWVGFRWAHRLWWGQH